MKNLHGEEIVVAADRSDWGKKQGLIPPKRKGCWCYKCTIEYLERYARVNGPNHWEKLEDVE